MIAFTTRNRPNVLDYSLKKTREHYDGYIVVIDDNSDGDFNEEICKRWDCVYLYNETRLGIPYSKARGFGFLRDFDRQIWFDDDCFPKEGFIDRVTEAMETQGHILHLKEWAHIAKKADLPGDLVSYTGATACMMTFRKDMYEDVRGFHVGYTKYGHWHSRLSQKMAKYGLDEYVSLNDVEQYAHSFDMCGVPDDFKHDFHSCMSSEERNKELTSWKK